MKYLLIWNVAQATKGIWMSECLCGDRDWGVAWPELGSWEQAPDVNKKIILKYLLLSFIANYYKV